MLEHVLVVEDDASIAEWISDYLTHHGYQVSVANRGDKAVSRYFFYTTILLYSSFCIIGMALSPY